jgi:serine/threonine protein kinase HipA of HipAB toxin-antitoxin module
LAIIPISELYPSRNLETVLNRASPDKRQGRIADAMRRHDGRHLPPTEIVRLLDMVVFNVLACNTDAHAKNYSIMLRGSGASLAPMYDDSGMVQ